MMLLMCLKLIGGCWKLEQPPPYLYGYNSGMFCDFHNT